MNDTRAMQVSRRLLRPYPRNPSSPYLSKEQQELCEMTLAERSAWMAGWLKMAAAGERNVVPIRPHKRSKESNS